MKSFLVLYNKKQINLLNDTLLNDHINYLKELDSQGALMLCGPLTSNEQAMFYIKSVSHDDVRQLILKDPFIREKYYTEFSIDEFLPANSENNWLMSSSQTLNNLAVSLPLSSKLRSVKVEKKI